jgi:AraC-like DNA-binding protein
MFHVCILWDVVMTGQGRRRHRAGAAVLTPAVSSQRLRSCYGLNVCPLFAGMSARQAPGRDQTDMGVINVALACGFTSPSHFSKCYRAHYQTTPYRERGSQGEKGA